MRAKYLHCKLLTRVTSKQKRVLRTIKRLFYKGNFQHGNLHIYKTNMQKYNQLSLFSKFFHKVFAISKYPTLSCILCQTNLKIDFQNDQTYSYTNFHQKINQASLYLGCNVCNFAWCSGCHHEFMEISESGKAQCLICSEKRRLL